MNPFSLARCPGPFNRREALTAGAIGMLGLSWPKLLAAAEERYTLGTRQEPGFGKAKACIFIYLDGGMSHIDTLDMKPDSPVEMRGEFKPLDHSPLGLTICEHLPKLASVAPKCSFVRSMGQRGRGVIGNAHHTGAYYYLTGREPDESFGRLRLNRTPLSDDWPYIGSVVSYKHPPTRMPPSVALPANAHSAQYVRAGQFGAKIGSVYDPLFLLSEEETPGKFTMPALELPAELPVERLDNRRGLLAELDRRSRLADGAPGTGRLSGFRERAFSLLKAAGSAGAFDLEKEKPSLREAYGADFNCQSFLMARKLVEAGVPFVSVFWKKWKKTDDGCSSWDTHRDNFNCLKNRLLPPLDSAFPALVNDLDDRGLLDDTLVVLVSEMGRTPKVGDPRPGGENGRDHWTHCQTVTFAGGGVKRGFVLGSSDRIAAYPDERVGPEDLAATIYHALGLDDLTATTPDGRQFSLIDRGRPMVELFA